MIEVKNICYAIGGRNILKDVSFAIRPGETLAVIGPNGSGKSTLLKLISGELKPSSGAIRIEDCADQDWERRELAKIRAVLPQSSSLSFPFTVYEVAQLGRFPHGGRNGTDHAIVRATLARVDLSLLEERNYPALSGGEQQRTQLARTLAQIWEQPAEHPRYLLLDEPTSSLDLAHQHRTLQLAREFSARRTGVAVVLHDLNLALQYADRILLLKDGKCIALGRPDEIAESALLREVFQVGVTVLRHPSANCPLVVTQAFD